MQHFLDDATVNSIGNDIASVIEGAYLEGISTPQINGVYINKLELIITVPNHITLSDRADIVSRLEIHQLALYRLGLKLHDVKIGLISNSVQFEFVYNPQKRIQR